MDNLATQNHRNLRRLVMAIKASYHRLNLLISICDNWHYRDTVIQSYERELQSQAVQCHRLRIDRSQPSLKQSLRDFMAHTPALKETPAIVTVLGADELLGIRLNDPKSAQEQFFFSVQWTREAFREFTFPIILWLTPPIATGLAQQAPDFWSWRGGVFEFSQPLTVHSASTEPCPRQTLPEHHPHTSRANPQDLAQQIQDLQHSDPHSPLLGSLYHSLGDAYQATARYAQAETAYRQAITLREQQLGVDHPDTATSLHHLAGLYYDQGRYSEAEPLYQRAVTIREQQLGVDHPDTATSLHHLAGLYCAQGRYGEAEPLYQRAVTIREQQLGADHPDTATSLSDLAGLYHIQGRYDAAEPLYQRAITIREQQLGADHPDTAISLHNLALLYQSQGRYREAEPLYQRLGAKHRFP